MFFSFTIHFLARHTVMSLDISSSFRAHKIYLYFKTHVIFHTVYCNKFYLFLLSLVPTNQARWSADAS